jgi:hypothetical protein
MKKALPFLLLFFCLSAFSQINSDSLEYRIRPDSSRTGELHLSINNFNYLRNYEFYNKIQDGYTLYGTQLEPQLVYYAHPRLALMAGAHLRKDFGGKGIYKTYPLFSIKYQKDNTAFITGALEGNIQHRFIEPLFDFEKKITGPVEYGTQFVVNRPSLFLDAFINWKRMIYKLSSEQEQIVAGLSSDISVFSSESLRLSIPVQAIVFHQGGQIDVVDKPLQTLLNTAIGFSLNYKQAGFIQNLHTNNYLVTYKEASPTKMQAYANGNGIYLNAGADSRYGSLSASYWNADKFIAANGMPIFQSVSQQIDYPGYAQSKRELLFIRYAFQKELVPNFYVDFRVEPVMDLGLSEKKFELYHSLFVTYKQQFRLTRAH